MADVVTDNLELTKQTIGGNDNTWGTILNATIQLIDDGWGKTAAVATTGGNTNLGDSNEIVHRINVTGTLVSNATLTMTGRGGKWIVSNNTSGAYTVTILISGQTGVVIPQGESRLVFYDGTDISELDFSTTGLLAAANNLDDLSNAATARTNLGLTADGSSLVTAANYAAMRALLDLEAGTDFNAYDALLANLSTIGDNLLSGDIVYATAANTLARLAKGSNDQVLTLSGGLPSWQDASVAGGDLVSTNNLDDLDDAPTARANLGLGSLATLNNVNNDNWSGTDLAVINGGTGASNAAGARSALAAAAAAQTKAILPGVIRGSVANGDIRLVINLPFGGTITKTTTRSVSGTGTATWKVNTTALGATNAISSTENEAAQSSSNTFSAGDDIVLTISSASSLNTVSFTIQFSITLD